MNNTSILPVIISIFIIGTILSIWFFVGIRHFKALQNEILLKWKLLDIKIKMRHNIIPNLVETIRKYTLTEDYDSILTSREKAMREYFPSGKKFEYEYDLTVEIERILDYGDNHESIQFSTNFLELRKEFKDLISEMEILSNEYNKKVRNYNKSLKIILLRPVAFLFRFKFVNIFDI